LASSLLALLDDITTILDDVALLTRVAAKKTAGVLGDDLALNAQQVSGVAADRELPVVWAVAKGSLVNKAILVPGALVISAVAPWLVSPLMMIGGAYLCYEGFEKLVHVFAHRNAGDAAHKEELVRALADPAIDLKFLERDKIKGAIRTDFVLSAEIIVISLGTVATAAFPQRVAALVGIALLMTVGVYGLVAGIVKLDDGGLHLIRQTGSGLFAQAQRGLGAGILWTAPWLMKGLSVVGTLAMFLVGGGIISHGIGPLHHWLEGLPGGLPVSLLLDALTGVIAGAVVVGAVLAYARLRRAAT
jgi:predicted DNA repair protein MutK